MSKIFGNSRGFTLIEIIVALVILGVIAAISTAALVKIVESYQWTKDNAHLTQKAQVALTRIAVELNYATKIENVTGNSIRYDAEYPDGTASEDNRIRRQQENLILREENDSYILADGVIGFNASKPDTSDSDYDYEDYIIDIVLSLEGENGIEQTFTTSIAHR
ncbi:MAG: type II secretion system GspH family protein [Desulfobacteraceae bacterium]|nr:type II secretion system GspH family protein [Desulfobacteraceae bacterium]